MDFLKKRKRHFGDRVDGHWVKDAPGLNVIMTGLYPNRTDCEVSGQIDIDVTESLKYIEKRKAQDPNCKLKFFHLYVAALTRVLNERRLLCRFVRNLRIYERDEITISFVAKRSFNDKAEEALVTYKAREDDNVDKVSAFILGEVGTVRANQDMSSEKKGKDITKSIDGFAKLPRFILKPLIDFVRALDVFGWVPKGFRQGDPAFSTALISNLGSIKCASCYHHLNNYGTGSIMMTIGTIRKVPVTKEDGSVEYRDFVDVQSTVDERIADGFYFTRSVQLLAKYLKHPEVLEKNFNEDVEIED